MLVEMSNLPFSHPGALYSSVKLLVRITSTMSATDFICNSVLLRESNVSQSIFMLGSSFVLIITSGFNPNIPLSFPGFLNLRSTLHLTWSDRLSRLLWGMKLLKRSIPPYGISHVTGIIHSTT
uniref:Uncharacterized protein n=1 Tax=Pinctada fucata TaxID=50426 RepID=A0A194AQF0_PINFU